jgi:hypothetical protein
MSFTAEQEGEVRRILREEIDRRELEVIGRMTAMHRAVDRVLASAAFYLSSSKSQSDPQGRG